MSRAVQSAASSIMSRVDSANSVLIGEQYPQSSRPILLRGWGGSICVYLPSATSCVKGMGRQSG